MSLLGRYYVVPTAAAVRDASALFRRRGDYESAKREALKLAYFPDPDPHGLVLDWSWIDGMGAPVAGELRVARTIGGYNNLRIIFWPATIAMAGDPEECVGCGYCRCFRKRRNGYPSETWRFFAPGSHWFYAGIIRD